MRKGVPSDYKGPRDAKGIVSYMVKQEGPSAKPITSADQFNTLTTTNRDVVVVGFFPSQSGAVHKSFVDSANALREDFVFYIVTDNSIMEAAKQNEGVVVYSPFTSPIVYSGSGSLTDFIWDASVPAVGEITKDNTARYKKKNLPVLKAFLNVDWASNAKQTNYYLNRLKKAAENSAFANKILFAIANKKDFADEIGRLGLTGQDPLVGIDDLPKSQKYRFTGEFNVKNLEQFAQDYLDGKLKSYIKSEPKPASNDAGVKVVTGETFNDIVMDPTKNVMIEFYAPWCGHCKKLEPKYNELGDKFKDSTDVVIAKMDATANDSPHAKYQAKGYPTIFFAPANDKENPIPFNGEREVDAMYKWIKDRAQKPKATKDEL
jgi:protein disulfide isomerase family A protein 3